MRSAVGGLLLFLNFWAFIEFYVLSMSCIYQRILMTVMLLCVLAIIFIILIIICDRLNIHSTHGQWTVVCVGLQ